MFYLLITLLSFVSAFYIRLVLVNENLNDRTKTNYPVGIFDSLHIESVIAVMYLLTTVCVVMYEFELSNLLAIIPGVGIALYSKFVVEFSIDWYCKNFLHDEKVKRYTNDARSAYLSLIDHHYGLTRIISKLRSYL